MSLLLDRLMEYSADLPRTGVSISFSGGVDSLLLTLCARKHVPVRCIVAGTPGSSDIRRARRTAAVLDIPLDVVEITPSTYRFALSRVAPFLDEPSPMKANLSVVMYLAFGKARSGTVLVGHGADERFGGYRKYLRADDWRTLRDNDLERLLNSDMPRYRALGRLFGKEVAAPFLDPLVGDAADGTPGKPQIYEALGEFGLKGPILPPKRAMQFGSGAARMLERLAKKERTSERSIVLHFMEDSGGV